MKVDLRFADIFVNKTEIRVIGKRKDKVFNGEASVEVPAAEQCTFRITPARLISVISAALFASENGTQPYRMGLKGEDGASLIISSGRRKGTVKLSVAQVKDRVVLRRSSGIINPFTTAVLLDAAAELLRQEKRHLIPLGGVATVVWHNGSEVIHFMDAEGDESELDESWKKRLHYSLTARLLMGKDAPVRFRAGKIRIVEQEDGIIFSFKKFRSFLEARLSPENVGLMWAITGGSTNETR